jgi:hypothetical protein
MTPRMLQDNSRCEKVFVVSTWRARHKATLKHTRKKLILL